MRTPGATLLVAFVLAPNTASAFTPPSSVATINRGVAAVQKQQRKDTTTLFVSPTNDNNENSERRKFLSQVALGSIVGWSSSIASPNAANAADWLSNIPGSDQARKKILNGPVAKIRTDVGRIMDELQRDLMQERWDLVESYPAQLRSYVPIFTTYTDSAFPSDEATDKGLRIALRYEVGRFFASVERLKQATSRKALNEAYVAYSDMSLHLDRYMRVGGIYTYYDDTITTETYFQAIPDSALVYADPIKDPAEVRDLIMLRKGPDKGKTGIVIGIYPDGSSNCVVKLDRFKGMREIRVVPLDWAAKRLGEQDPDDVFLLPRKAAKV
mmetsp:Transcript_25590/g.36051  ORF Transcript_25590/g.36051 Transcript_25590/m.36051 type:complete len:327 (-) Transcript_25590:65-1045(-)